MDAGRSDLERFADGREGLINALDAVPGEVQAWAQDQATKEVLRIAAFRQQVSDLHQREMASARPPLSRDSLWLGISDLERGILGEENAQALLFMSEELRGRAEGDRELAARLAKSHLEQNPDLQQAIEKLDMAAQATAAHNVLQAQRLIDSAPEIARASGFAEPISDPIPPPTKRYAELMDSNTHSLLSRCSDAVADYLTELDDGSLAHLARATAKSWSKGSVDPNVASLQGRLGRQRDTALEEGLAAARRWGKNRNDFDQMIGEQMRAELQEINKQMSGLPEAGSPDRLLREDLAAAAIHDASQQVLLERAGPSRELGPEAGPDTGMELW